MTRITDPEIMEKNQTAFLGTIRRALGKTTSQAPANLFGTPPADVDERLTAYLNRTNDEKQALLEVFKAQAEPVHANVTPVKSASAAGQAIRELAAATEPEWGSEKSVAAWQHPLIEALGLESGLKEDGIDYFITADTGKPGDKERDESRKAFIRSYIGITSADFCLAQTATLVMRTRPGQPRAVSLVPSIHVAVITLDQIIDSLKELYFRLKWDPKEKELGLTNCMTLISGPSKTADIELQMVFGAHGPRQLYVYVITGENMSDK